MPKFNHVMLDLETLSTRTDACIIQIAAIAFDIETGELGPRFNAYVNEALMIGEPVGHIDPHTVGWWMRQKFAPALGAMLTDEDERRSLGEALGDFAEWYDNLTDNCDDGEGKPPTEDIRLWGHGATFDIPILQNAYQQRCPEVHEGQVPWHYRSPRDTRTLFDVAPGGMPKPPKDETREHDAQYDCEYQIAQVCGALAALREQRELATSYVRLEQEALAAPDGSVAPALMSSAETYARFSGQG
ncbi:MAG TPA: 3'-5' exonuclease [Polyangiaceae bacterium]